MGGKPRGRGRPRINPEPTNDFATWLAGSGRSVSEVAKHLGVAVSTVYGLRNATFDPGSTLAGRIDAMIASWPTVAP